MANRAVEAGRPDRADGASRPDRADRARLKLAATVLDGPDARELAAFYRRLLGWETAVEEPDWVELRPPGGGAAQSGPAQSGPAQSGPALSFQTEAAYVPPVWPTGPGDPQMSMQMDIEVDGLDEAAAHAVAAGARLAEFQPQDDVRVHLDPAGHPFCLFRPE